MPCFTERTCNHSSRLQIDCCTGEDNNWRLHCELDRNQERTDSLLYEIVFFFHPIQKKLLFDSCGGRQCSDNPRSFFDAHDQEELNSVLRNRNDTDLDNSCRKVKEFFGINESGKASKRYVNE